MKKKIPPIVKRVLESIGDKPLVASTRVTPTYVTDCHKIVGVYNKDGSVKWFNGYKL